MSHPPSISGQRQQGLQLRYPLVRGGSTDSVKEIIVKGKQHIQRIFTDHSGSRTDGHTGHPPRQTILGLCVCLSLGVESHVFPCNTRQTSEGDRGSNLKVVRQGGELRRQTHP